MRTRNWLATSLEYAAAALTCVALVLFGIASTIRRPSPPPMQEGGE